MAQSSILGGRRAPQRNEASRTGMLGPSDTSDSGSDVQGGPGLVDAQALGLDSGPTSDLDRRAGAGADLGDSDLDSDSDSGGSGERALADRDGGWVEGADIAPDRIEGGDELALAAEDEELEDMTADELSPEDDVDNTDEQGRLKGTH
ncbi:hypothetical protein OOT46_00365 [Aquabacterium sp. A7-Y]|uniref:hypothetical protein n=1 Tax=Aquabacterium sp. A7-Y TaxID=1349605 RepID=UPI00223E744C|nr:hypothetical protein [Aquabacterium sp. A7-Y]MCW7536306.1 hypothetical protein [Aquabacterium sp. A7-Y]